MVVPKDLVSLGFFDARMTITRRILVLVLGAVLAGAAAGEHLFRRLIQRRYRQAVEGRQQLERQVGGILATHRQLASDLATERGRTQELTNAFAEKSAELEKAVARLTEESQTVRTLQGRLAAMERQMDHLQGELATVLQNRAAGAPQGKPLTVHLERIVVGKAGASNLQGRVVSVHEDWRFVIIDLGWDIVKVGDTVSIFRNEQLLAKARVERVQEVVSAATLLPNWESASIHVNDRVELL